MIADMPISLAHISFGTFPKGGKQDVMMLTVFLT